MNASVAEDEAIKNDTWCTSDTTENRRGVRDRYLSSYADPLRPATRIII